MLKKIPLLAIAAIIFIADAIITYQLKGRQGDHEGWGLLAAYVFIAVGILAIIIDLVLLWLVKNNTTRWIIEIILIITGVVFLYNR